MVISRSQMNKQISTGAKKMKKKLKPVDKKKNPGLPKLPKKVRNNMGFMKDGGIMVQGRGCGAMMNSKRKKTRIV